ncbi:MAG: hypothetical protein JO126_02745 [Alphaproteobacteria bacterium]|nr:hypothetical protein [Alphaproteobacteria bacterium]
MRGFSTGRCRLSPQKWAGLAQRRRVKGYTISYVPGTLTILPVAGTINAGTFLKSFTDVQTAPITLVNASAIFYLVAQPAMDFPTVQNSSRTDDMLIGFEKN